MRRGLRLTAAILVLALVLSACASPGAQSVSLPPPLSPEETVEAVLGAVRAMKALDFPNCIIQEGGTDLGTILVPENPTSAETLRVVFDRLSYKMGDVAIDGDTATVAVAITSVDMVGVFIDVITRALSLAFTASFGEGPSETDMQAALEKTLLDALEDPDAPMITKDVSLCLKIAEGKWMVFFDEESANVFANAVTGGLGDVAKVLNSPD